MSLISFADVVHQSIHFSNNEPTGRLVLDLIDSSWVQRLRDVHQTANTRLVYMFSEHSRFGHSLGVAYLASQLLQKLEQDYKSQVEEYRDAVVAAALLHDIGHLAPGSHVAFKIWFPDQQDSHEDIAAKIIQSDPELNTILKKYGEDLPEKIIHILQESSEVPPWTWQLISGGGWNVDRGNWCIVDSIFAGVGYGKYNIPALTNSICITDKGQLAIRENRLDAMMHFAVSRQAMYRQIYQHRVLLSADKLCNLLINRARNIRTELSYADKPMEQVLNIKSADELSLSTIFLMRESWWKYHLMQWLSEKDSVLRDLSDRALHRKLFKTVQIRNTDDAEALYNQAREAVEKANFDPQYYIAIVKTSDVLSGDSKQSILVQRDSGEVIPLREAEPLYRSMMEISPDHQHRWIILPEEAKQLIGRNR